MRTLAVTVLVLLINGCTSVAYVENGAVSGSQCKNTVKIDESCQYVLGRQ